MRVPFQREKVASWLTSAPIELRIVRSLKRRVTAMYARFMLGRCGVRMEGPVNVCGLPLVSLVPGSTLRIGTNVSLISWSQYNPIGVNHPVILRTLRCDAKLLIGDNVGISGASICAAESITIGSDTLIGANVLISDTDFHPIDARKRVGHSGEKDVKTSPVYIGQNVFIGANTIVLKGAVIGAGSAIGAGSVVTGRIPAGVIAAGNPCRVLRLQDTRDVTANHVGI